MAVTVPTSYTMDALLAYLHEQLGSQATDLGWSVAGGDYDEIAIATMLAYGTDDITEVDGIANVARLRTLARCELWRKVMGELAQDYDTTNEAGTRRRSQPYKHAEKQYQLAYGDALAFDPNYRVRHIDMEHEDAYMNYAQTEDSLS